jgi:hypothetical protein
VSKTAAQCVYEVRKGLRKAEAAGQEVHVPPEQGGVKSVPKTPLEDGCNLSGSMLVNKVGGNCSKRNSFKSIKRAV